MADAADSKSAARKGVWVRLPPPAPTDLPRGTTAHEKFEPLPFPPRKNILCKLNRFNLANTLFVSTKKRGSMRRRMVLRCARALFCLLACLATCRSVRPQDSKLVAAESAIRDRIAESGADVAVYFKTLDGKAEWSFRAEDVFHAASTMKVPVMIELFRQVKQGRLKLDDQLVIKNQFHSIVDGSPYTLNSGDDSEDGMYKAEGQSRTLKQLCELMITVSSNFATNLLIEKLGVENIRATVHDLGADGVNVLRGVEDAKAYEKGLSNTTTARGLAILLQAIAKGKAVDNEGCKEMIAILQRQKFNEGIPAGLPGGISVAHKTGEITKIHHDAAIVFAKRPFVLVILVRGVSDKKESSALMADVSRNLYEATQ
jgi:beta-lactamase class A